MPGSLLAIDVALLLPPEAHDLVTRLNARLAGPPDGFRLDADHLPHISLVQQFVPATDLPLVSAEVGAVLAAAAPLTLVAERLRSNGVTTSLDLAPTRPLATLHARLMDRLAPFDMTAGDAGAFLAAGEPPRGRDVEWVTRFRTAAAYAAFEPHVTLGVGVLDDPAPALEFEARQIAVCRLGRFCTCRRVLASWTLAGQAGT